MYIGLRVMLTQTWRRVCIDSAALKTHSHFHCPISLYLSRMAPAPNDKSDSTSETPAEAAAGYLLVIFLSLVVILFFMFICAILDRYV